MTHAPEHRSDERGAALLTALLIVAVMAAVSISVLETMRFATRMSTNLEEREQARLFALGAEELVSATIIGLKATGGENRTPGLDAWTQEAFSFPIPGGLVEGRARDGANCFNVNALVNSEGSEGSTGSLANAARFALLIEQLGYTEQEGESIAAAITDWIDPDNSPGFGGAEDPIYATRTRPYRTGGTPIADISELRLIQGVDDERYDVLEEFLCARDDNEFNPLNLNTLEPWQAPLLSSVLGNQVDISAADRLILERPASGYGTVSDALTADVLGTQDLPPDFLDRFSLKSDYYDVEMTVRYRSAVINMTTSLKIRQAGGITTLSRRYGTFE